MTNPPTRAKPDAPKPRQRQARARSAPAPAQAAAAKRRSPAAVAEPAAAPARKKQKMVRDGFTMPEPDFALIGALKARALKAGRETRKSEVLRAGLQVLAALDDAALLAALNRLQPVKTGRPRKGH